MHTRNILVTGGGGFIGSHLVEQLLARGDRVVVIDDFSTGRRENLASVAGPSLEVLEGTVSDMLPTLEPGSFDEIYHLAAAVGVRLIIERPIHAIETNVHETSHVLQFAAQTGTRLLVASTSEVYGKSTRMPFSEDDDVVYGPTTLHRWSYACSKAIDEYLAIAYAREHDLPVVIARFFNTVGPRQVGEYGMVVPRFVDAATGGRTLQVYGDGTQTRCFCDVRDVVRVLPDLITSADLCGRVVNVGRDERISIRDLAELVVSTLDSRSEIECIPYDRAFGAGFDDLQDRVPDLTRIREAIGFEPRIPLEQTIRDVAAVLVGDAR